MTTDPDTVPGVFLYTVALTGSLPVAQVYDAGLNTGYVCVFTARVSQQPRWTVLLLAVMMAAGGERCRQSLVRYLQELHSEPPTEPRDPGRNSDQSFYQRVMSARFRYLLQIREVSTCGQKLCNSVQQ